MANNAATVQLATGFSRDALEYLLTSKNEPDWLRARRREAWHLYEETPLPASNDELWRRTSLKDLKFDAVVPLTAAVWASPPDHLRVPTDARGSGVVMQYNTTHTETWLADEVKKRGVVFTDLNTAIQTHPDWVREYLMTQAVTYTENRYAGSKTTKSEGAAYGDTIGDLKFVALHGAFLNVGTFLYVPRGVTVELPLQSLTHFDAPNVAIFAHTLVIVEEGASVTLIERFTSQETEAQRFANSAVELILKPGASLQYFYLQDFARNVWNFTSQTALLDRDAQLTWLNGTLGSQTTKAFLDCKFIGKGAQANLLGFFFGDDKQHFDQHTFQNHLVGQTASDLLYKGALKDRAYSVFRGLIRVNPNAQRSDAYQANRNLLLSPNAHADSIPELEIQADDVRCTHGATVGPIDPDQIFYSMARGIPQREAERLIVEGFFDPLMQKIPLESIRNELAQVIQRKIGV